MRHKLFLLTLVAALAAAGCSSLGHVVRSVARPNVADADNNWVLARASVCSPGAQPATTDGWVSRKLCVGELEALIWFRPALAGAGRKLLTDLAREAAFGSQWYLDGHFQQVGGELRLVADDMHQR